MNCHKLRSMHNDEQNKPKRKHKIQCTNDGIIFLLSFETQLSFATNIINQTKTDTLEEYPSPYNLQKFVNAKLVFKIEQCIAQIHIIVICPKRLYYVICETESHLKQHQFILCEVIFFKFNFVHNLSFEICFLMDGFFYEFPMISASSFTLAITNCRYILC